MKQKIALGIAFALLAPGLVQAGCSVGDPRNPPQIPPTPSTTTSETPTLSGTAPYNTTWVQVVSQLPPAEQAVLQRVASNTQDYVLSPIFPNEPSPTPGPPGGGGGGSRCDSIRTNLAGNQIYNSSFMERVPTALGLRKHRIEFDFTYYEGNSDPVSGERSWWPVASWQLPSGPWGATLRLDYSGWQTGYSWTNPGSMFRVYLDDVFIGSAGSSTDKPTVELSWSQDGDIQLAIAADPVPGANVQVIDFPLPDAPTSGFQPTSFMVGRTYLPYWLRPSKGTVYAYSHLDEAEATQQQAYQF